MKLSMLLEAALQRHRPDVPRLCRAGARGPGEQAVQQPPRVLVQAVEAPGA